MSVDAFICGATDLTKKKKKKDAAFSPHNIVNSFEKQKKKHNAFSLVYIGDIDRIGNLFLK